MDPAQREGSLHLDHDDVRGCVADVLANVHLRLGLKHIADLEVAGEHFAIWKSDCAFEGAQRKENGCGVMVLHCLLPRKIAIFEDTNAFVLKPDFILVTVSLNGGRRPML